MGNFFKNLSNKFKRVKSYDIPVNVSYRMKDLGTVLITVGGRSIEDAREKATEVVERELVCTAGTGKKTGDFEISNKL